MRDLCVIVDLSGSMYELGKPAIIANVLSTLSTLETLGDENERLVLTKLQWDGDGKSLEPILEKCMGVNTLLLTDGYSISDDCRSNRTVKTLMEEKKDSLFVVLCGGDAVNISSFKEFSRVKTVNADNILFALENFDWKEMRSSDETVGTPPQDDGDDWE